MEIKGFLLVVGFLVGWLLFGLVLFWIFFFFFKYQSEYSIILALKSQLSTTSVVSSRTCQKGLNVHSSFWCDFLQWDLTY